MRLVVPSTNDIILATIDEQTRDDVVLVLLVGGDEIRSDWLPATIYSKNSMTSFLIWSVVVVVVENYCTMVDRVAWTRVLIPTARPRYNNHRLRPVYNCQYLYFDDEHDHDPDDRPVIDVGIARRY